MHTFLAEGLYGTAYHRAILPARNTGGVFVLRDKWRNLMRDEDGRVIGSPHPAGKTMIYHMPAHDWQVAEIERLKEEGARVIVDVDDYLPGVGSSEDHGFAHTFSEREYANVEQAIKLAGELSVSTEWLGETYGHLVERVWLTPNGIDVERFPQHRHGDGEPPVIVWSGATGHARALERIVPAIVDVMRENEETLFWVLGEEPSFCMPDELVGRTRIFPWQSRAEYPKVLSRANIAIAPDRPTDFYRAKSALRFYEAAACGLATVGGCVTYSEIRNGDNGLLADSVDEWRDALRLLVSDVDVRRGIGESAYRSAQREFSMMRRAVNWDAMVHADAKVPA